MKLVSIREASDWRNLPVNPWATIYWDHEGGVLPDTGDMPADDSLKRLGGGRWETRDGRFAIEPQSGTWVVVDNTQTDDLGLPLVRGPFGSLTAAKEAIEGIRTSGPVESPLAGRLKEARAARKSKAKGDSAAGKQTLAKGGERQKATAPPDPPPEPKWLRELAPSDRRRARELIVRLEKLEIAEAQEIARSEIERNQPALVREAIQRALRRTISTARSPAAAVRATIEVLLSGKDAELGVRWRVVDDEGRPVGVIDLPE